jgi:uncharacterized protein DUF5666/BACON domain-containing protein/all-beta uncharacterized protein
MRRHVFGFIVASSLAGAVIGCTSSQVSSTIAAPTSAKCQVQVGSTTTSFTSDGGQGTLAVTTTRDCAWSATTSANWVAITNASGQGEASVPYTVAANPMPATRAAAITVSDATLQLNQAAAPCRYTLSPTAGSIGAAGGVLTAQLSTLAGCSWTTGSDSSWVSVSVTSGGSGVPNSTITMTVAANGGAARSARMTAGNASFIISQAAAGSAPPPTPTPPPPTPPPPTQLSGTLSGLSGKCPTVSFTVSSKTVTTTSATAFTGTACNDLRTGRAVLVTGTLQSNGSVVATIVDQE